MLARTLIMCALGIGLAGCSKTETTAQGDTAKSESQALAAHGEAGHSHDGWWCNEHGLPEEVCTLCNATLVADFKAKGDWCQEHDRPETQCFICHPENQKKFTAQYVAKYGKQPPAAGDADHAGHDHDHDHGDHQH